MDEYDAQQPGYYGNGEFEEDEYTNESSEDEIDAAKVAALRAQGASLGGQVYPATEFITQEIQIITLIHCFQVIALHRQRTSPSRTSFNSYSRAATSLSSLANQNNQYGFQNYLRASGPKEWKEGDGDGMKGTTPLIYNTGYYKITADTGTWPQPVDLERRPS